MIYIKETEINFERGTAVVPIVHCSSNIIYLMSGGLVGNVYKRMRKVNKNSNSNDTFKASN